MSFLNVLGRIDAEGKVKRYSGDPIHVRDLEPGEREMLRAVILTELRTLDRCEHEMAGASAHASQPAAPTSTNSPPTDIAQLEAPETIFERRRREAMGGGS